MAESEAEFKAGRFKVSVAPPPETSVAVGRFRLIPQGSPFLQRGRFSVIPEEETGGGSPLVQTKLSGPKIVVDPVGPEWDFLVSSF